MHKYLFRDRNWEGPGYNFRKELGNMPALLIFVVFYFLFLISPTFPLWAYRLPVLFTIVSRFGNSAARSTSTMFVLTWRFRKSVTTTHEAPTAKYLKWNVVIFGVSKGSRDFTGQILKQVFGQPCSSFLFSESFFSNALYFFKARSDLSLASTR